MSFFATNFVLLCMLIIASIVTVISWKEHRNPYLPNSTPRRIVNQTIWVTLIISIIGGVFYGLLMFVEATFVQAHLRDTKQCEQPTGSTSIYTLRDGSSINGRFVLGSGSVSSYMKYRTYVKRGPGYKLIQLSTSKTYIVETSDTPKWETTYNRCRFSRFSEFLFGKEYLAPMIQDHVSYHTLYVPHNTIIREFRLDGE